MQLPYEHFVPEPEHITQLTSKDMTWSLREDASRLINEQRGGLPRAVNGGAQIAQNHQVERRINAAFNETIEKCGKLCTLRAAVTVEQSDLVALSTACYGNPEVCDEYHQRSQADFESFVGSSLLAHEDDYR